MFYEQNLRLLKANNPQLEEDLKEISLLEVINTQDGFVFKVVDEQNKEFFTASIYNPGLEADHYLSSFNMDNSGYFLQGINSSALVERLLARIPQSSWLIINEFDLAVIKTLLTYFDFSPYVDETECHILFLYGAAEMVYESLQYFLYNIIGLYFIQPEILLTYPAMRTFKERYQQAFDYFRDILINNVYNMGNDVDDTLLGLRNEIRNMKHILTGRQLKQLHLAYKDVPIVCVASGPSLDKQLPLLKAIQNKVLIISAESALKALLKHGITPDILCILERGYSSFEFSLKGIEIPKETVLCSLSIIDPVIYDYWHELKIPMFKNNISFSGAINAALGDYGSYSSGNSVAHLNYGLACYLGGGPIILIGQDLAFADDGSHHSKSTEYGNMDAETTMRLQLTVDNNNSITYVDGYYGGKVKSRELWKQFLIWFEVLIRKNQIVTINATEGGAKISGTIQMSFQEVVEQYCQNDIRPFHEFVRGLPMNSDVALAFSQFSSYYGDIKEKMNGFLDRATALEEKTKEAILKIDDLNVDLANPFFFEVLQENEKLIIDILKYDEIEFYFKPIIAELHVVLNPIFRVSSTERLLTILEIEKWFNSRIVKEAKKLVALIETELMNLETVLLN